MNQIQEVLMATQDLCRSAGNDLMGLAMTMSHCPYGIVYHPHVPTEGALTAAR